MLLKLDLEKACDCLEWPFVRITLLFFNFPTPIIKLIMSCITTSLTSILINGTRTPYFCPSRGIRQGDPLSPYLFIMCMKMLSCIIYLSVDYLQWQPIKLSKSVPLLSHLFFADDIILLAKVSTKSCHANIDTLNHFTNYSGQKINFQKSKNLFLKNCSQANKIFILDSFQMSEGTIIGKYLGFPMFN